MTRTALHPAALALCALVAATSAVAEVPDVVRITDGNNAGPAGRNDGPGAEQATVVHSVVDGHRYLMERSLVPDVSLVKAWKADKSGNLIYRKTARNFNPNVAMAGKITVAEVEELVETGSLDPDNIHTPGIFVHRIVVNPGAADR